MSINVSSSSINYNGLLNSSSSTNGLNPPPPAQPVPKPVDKSKNEGGDAPNAGVSRLSHPRIDIFSSQGKLDVPFRLIDQIQALSSITIEEYLALKEKCEAYPLPSGYKASLTVSFNNRPVAIPLAGADSFHDLILFATDIAVYNRTDWHNSLRRMALAGIGSYNTRLAMQPSYFPSHADLGFLSGALENEVKAPAIEITPEGAVVNLPLGAYRPSFTNLFWLSKAIKALVQGIDGEERITLETYHSYNQRCRRLGEDAWSEKHGQEFFRRVLYYVVDASVLQRRPLVSCDSDAHSLARARAAHYQQASVHAKYDAVIYKKGQFILGVHRAKTEAAAWCLSTFCSHLKHRFSEEYENHLIAMSESLLSILNKPGDCRYACHVDIAGNGYPQRTFSVIGRDDLKSVFSELKSLYSNRSSTSDALPPRPPAIVIPDSPEIAEQRNSDIQAVPESREKIQATNVPSRYLECVKAPDLPTAALARRSDQIQDYVRVTFKMVRDMEAAEHWALSLEEGGISGTLLMPKKEPVSSLPLTAIIAGRGGDALVPDDETAPVLIVTTESADKAKRWVGKNRQVLIIESFLDYPEKDLGLMSIRRAMAIWAAKQLGYRQVFVLDDNIEKWCLKNATVVRWSDIVTLYQEKALEHSTAILGASEHSAKKWTSAKSKRLTSEEMSTVPKTGSKAHFIDIKRLLDSAGGEWEDLIPPRIDFPQEDQLLYFLAEASGQSVAKISSSALLFIRSANQPGLCRRAVQPADRWLDQCPSLEDRSSNYQTACQRVQAQVQQSKSAVEKHNQAIVKANLAHCNRSPLDVWTSAPQTALAPFVAPRRPLEERSNLPVYVNEPAELEMTAPEAMAVLRSGVSVLSQDTSLREYQRRIFGVIEEKSDSGCVFHVTMATGLGKSEMMSKLAVVSHKNFRGKWNVVVVVRNLDQTDNAYERIKKIAGEAIPVIKLGTGGINWRHVTINERANREGQIVVGCQKSLKLLDEEHPNYLKRTGLFLVDETPEIHETLYQKIMSIARERALIAFSATPGQRLDDLIEIREMDALEGVRENYLAPWRTHQLPWRLFFDDSDQLDAEKVSSFLEDREVLMQHHLLIVVPSVGDADRLASEINRHHPNKALSITSSAQSSQKGIERTLQTTEFGPKVGIVCEKLLVGFDSAYLWNILVLRKMGRDEATQALGRVLRKDPLNNGKVAGFWMTEKVDLDPRYDIRDEGENPSRKHSREEVDIRSLGQRKEARKEVVQPEKNENHQPNPQRQTHAVQPLQAVRNEYVGSLDPQHWYSIPVQKGTSLEDSARLAAKLAAAFKQAKGRGAISQFCEGVRKNVKEVDQCVKEGWPTTILSLINERQEEPSGRLVYEYNVPRKRFLQIAEGSSLGANPVHIRKLPVGGYHVLLKR